MTDKHLGEQLADRSARPAEIATAATKRTVASTWMLPPHRDFHDVRLRRWVPDGRVDVLLEGTTIVAELSEADARLSADWLAGPTPGGGAPTEWRPAEQLIEFVAWKLRISIDSFYGRLLLLIAHADRANRAALHEAFPALVEAWYAWQAAGDGDFELPPAAARFVETGDVR